MKIRKTLLILFALAAVGAAGWLARPNCPVLQFVRHKPMEDGGFIGVFRIVNNSDSPYWYISYPHGPAVYRVIRTNRGLTNDRGYGMMCGTGDERYRVATIPPHSSVEVQTWGGMGGDYKIGMELFRGKEEERKPTPQWRVKLASFYSNLVFKFGREDWNPSYVWSELVHLPKERPAAKPSNQARDGAYDETTGLPLL